MLSVQDFVGGRAGNRCLYVRAGSGGGVAQKIRVEGKWVGGGGKDAERGEGGVTRVVSLEFRWGDREGNP